MFNKNLWETEHTAAKVVNKLLRSDYQAYIVGGAIRDIMLGLVPKDIDIATNAMPTEIKKLFSDNKINEVGNRFKVIKINGVDVATFRKDMQTVMFNAKHCKPVYADTIEEDLFRRDLTINAMAFNCKTDKVIDLFGGKRDIEERTIRFVGDEQKRIDQDPLRMIRACRFLAKIEGRFSKSTLATIRNNANYIHRYVDPERIRIEILEAMKVDTPSIFFCALYISGLLRYIFPDMVSCFNHSHGKHHLESISEHMMLAGDNIAKKLPLLRLAAFLHDIGKPMAYRKEGNGSFVKHENYGAKIVRYNLRLLKFSNKEVNYISGLVAAHMRTCRDLTPKGIRRLRKYLHDNGVDPRDYIRLKLADRLGNVKRDASRIQPIRELIVNSGIRMPYEEQPPLTIHDLKLKGGDIINIFGLEPGPMISKIQKMLLHMAVDIEDGNNREKLINAVPEIIKEINNEI